MFSTSNNRAVTPGGAPNILNAPSTTHSTHSTHSAMNNGESEEKGSFDFMKHFGKMVNKPPPFAKFQSFIHEEVFLTGRHGFDNGLSIQLQKPFSFASNCQAVVSHNTLIGFTPGMGMKPSAQHILGAQYVSNFGQFNIETQLPHFNLFNYAGSVTAMNKRLNLNVQVQDGEVQGRPQRDISGGITYRGPDYIADFDGSWEQKKFRLSYTKSLTEPLSMGVQLSHNNVPTTTDLAIIAHYLNGDKKSPNELFSLEQRVEDRPETSGTDRSMNYISKCAHLRRLNANTYLANELSVNWSQQVSKLKFGVKQKFPAGGELRVMVDDSLQVKAYCAVDIYPTIQVNLLATCNPYQDEYKAGVQINIIDTP